MVIIVSGDRQPLVERVAGISVVVIAKLVRYRIPTVDIVVDGAGLLGDVGFVGIRNWLDHPWLQWIWDVLLPRRSSSVPQARSTTAMTASSKS